MTRAYCLIVTGFLCAAEVLPQTAPAHRMTLQVERFDKSAWQSVDPSLVFSQKDRVRFRFQANFDGYLYVMNFSTTGKYELLYPRTDTGEDNRIAASQEYTVPATQGWFRVAGPPGHDVVYWVISPVDLGGATPQAPYVPLPPPPEPGKIPTSFTPRCDDTIFKARGECLDTSAGPRQVRQNEALPQNLESTRDTKRRELLFVQNKNQFVVSSPVPLDGPVIYEFRLAHK